MADPDAEDPYGCIHGQRARNRDRNRVPEDVFIFSQTDLKGRITEANGYQSIRFQPTREQGEAASEAYRRIRKGDRSLKIEDGRVVSQRAAWLETAAGSRMQLRLIMTFALAAAIPGVGALMAAPPITPFGWRERWFSR